jgi:hypothetical protein
MSVEAEPVITAGDGGEPELAPTMQRSVPVRAQVRSKGSG